MIYCLLLAVTTFHRVGVWKDSMTLWNDALLKYPENNDRGCQNRGNAFYDMGDYARALQDYNRLLTIDPRSDGAYTGIGRIKHARKDLRGALGDFNTSLSLRETYDGYIERAIVKTELNDFAGALADLDKAYQIHPFRTAVHVNRGYTRFLMGDYAGALQNYNQALQIDPQNSKAYLGRARIKQVMHDLDAALSDFNTSLSLRPSFDGYLNRAVLKMSLKNFEGARADLDVACQMEPSRPEVCLNKGIIELNTGNTTGALEEFNKALEIDANNFQAYLCRAIVKIRLEDFPGAIADLDRSIQLHPSGGAFYHRGIAKIRLGHKEEGRADLKQSASLGNADALAEIKEISK